MLFPSCSDCCTERRGVGRHLLSLPPHSSPGTLVQTPFLGYRHGPQKLTPSPRESLLDRRFWGRRGAPLLENTLAACPAHMAWAPRGGRRDKGLRGEGDPCAGVARLQTGLNGIRTLWCCGCLRCIRPSEGQMLTGQ